MRVVVFILCIELMALALVGFGLVTLSHQHQILKGLSPTNAIVTDINYATGPFGGYKPLIRFEYSVDAEAHGSSRLAPLPPTGSKRWADEVLNRYETGQQVEAFMNPLDRREVFLEPLSSFRPYIFVLAGVVVSVIGTFPLWMGGFPEAEPRPSETTCAGWYQLPQSTPVQSRCAVALTVAGIWYVAGLLLAGHYFFGLEPSYEGLSTVLVIYGVVGVLPVVMAFRALSPASPFGRPVILCTLPAVTIDKPVIIRLELPVERAVDVCEVRLSLVCDQYCGLSSRRLFSTSGVVTASEALRPEQPLFGDFTFEVPRKRRRPSSPFTRWDYPRINWAVELSVELRSTGRIWLSRFPIALVPPDPAGEQIPEQAVLVCLSLPDGRGRSGVEPNRQRWISRRAPSFVTRHDDDRPAPNRIVQRLMGSFGRLCFNPCGPPHASLGTRAVFGQRTSEIIPDSSIGRASGC